MRSQSLRSIPPSSGFLIGAAADLQQREQPPLCSLSALGCRGLTAAHPLRRHPPGYDAKAGYKYCYTGVCNATTLVCDPVPLNGPCNSDGQCVSGSSCVSSTCQVRGGATRHRPHHMPQTALWLPEPCHA